MQTELNILIAVTTAAFAVLSFFAGRQSAAEKSGARNESYKKDIEHLKTQLDNIVQCVSRNSEKIDDVLKRLVQAETELRYTISRVCRLEELNDSHGAGHGGKPPG